MQLTQSIRSNSYLKGVSNDIIFTLYISRTINLVNSQIGNHLEYKSRSTYESNNIDWALLNVDTFLIKVEILWLHIKLICKLERIGGSILYIQKLNKHWIPFIYDLRMLWSPIQNFESALGITCPHSFSLDFISGSGDRLKDDYGGYMQMILGGMFKWGMREDGLDWRATWLMEKRVGDEWEISKRHMIILERLK